MRRIAVRPAQRQRSTQRGQALLVIVAILAIGFAAAFYAFVGPTGAAIERDKITIAALTQAKDALVGWSAQRTSSGALPNARPGELPCPDMNNDGFEDGNCVAGAVGRVPWKTLGIPEPKDDAGETLWYAIAGPFRIWSLNFTVINSDTKGNIRVYKDSIASTITIEAVAVIFAPGAAFGAQARGCTVGVNCTATEQCTSVPASLTPKCNPANYLDLETVSGVNNAATNGPFISAQRSNTFNDRLLVITTADLIPLVEQRVARELRIVLQTYKTNTACPGSVCSASGGCYPWADVSDGNSDAPPFEAVGVGLNRGRVPAVGASPYNWGAVVCPGPPAVVAPTLPAWFTQNNWARVIYYSAGRNFLKAGGCSTCVDPALTVDISAKEVVILMPGPAGASRPPAALPDNPIFWQAYFEDTENLNIIGVSGPNDVYVTPSSKAYARDRIFTIP